MAVVAALTLTLLAPAASGAAEPARSGDETAFVDGLLARMTLEEKLGQLNLPRWGAAGVAGPDVPTSNPDDIRRGRVGTLGVYGAGATRRLQKIAVEESRLGIPLLYASDVIHGFRTIFPIPLGQAASFDVPLVERAARIAAIEAAAHGLHWTYAPMVDIARDPRWGRIAEGSGEDPYLGALLAAARVRGFQGHSLAANDTLLATAKHFVAYGAAQAGRDYNTVDLSERTLRELHLPPFKAAVDAGAGSVMAAFNEIAGVPMHAHRQLINGVLRGEWGFEGVVVSDYTGIRELIEHGVAATPLDAGLLALRAGVDIDMVSQIYPDELPAAVRAGRLRETLIDQAVRRVLRAKYRLGLFSDPYRYSDPARERAHTLRPEYRQAARQLARESLVLLKNDAGVLPFDKRLGTLAVIGPLAEAARDMLGNWASDGRDKDVITPLAGIRAAVVPDSRVLYTPGAEITGGDESGFKEAVRIAGLADAVVLCLGEDQAMSGEAASRASLELPGVQQALARAVLATGKPVAIVIFTGRPLTIKWLAEHAPAILIAWFPGIEAGPALADVLFGDHDPSGRLPVTFPRALGQVPISYDHKNTGRPPQADEKYTSKYLDVPWTPLYPFGYGLSYTTFRYRDLKLEPPRVGPADSVHVKFTVANTGERAGDEVVQLYLRDDVASVTRPVKELKRFQRIHLDAGESRELVFTLEPRDLSYYGPDLKPMVEPGTFTVFVGGNSRDLIETRLEVVAP